MRNNIMSLDSLQNVENKSLFERFIMAKTVVLNSYILERFIKKAKTYHNLYDQGRRYYVEVVWQKKT